MNRRVNRVDGRAYGLETFRCMTTSEREITDDVLIAAVHRVLTTDDVMTVFAFCQLCVLEGI